MGNDTEFRFLFDGTLMIMLESILQYTYIPIENILYWRINEMNEGHFVTIHIQQSQCFVYFYNDESLLRARAFCDRLAQERSRVVTEVDK